VKVDRRSFIKNSVAASLALPGFPHILGQAPEKYRAALIGTGWWGMNILHTAMESGQVKVVAMADVDENQLNPAAEDVEKLKLLKGHVRKGQFVTKLRKVFSKDEMTDDLEFVRAKVGDKDDDIEYFSILPTSPP